MATWRLQCSFLMDTAFPRDRMVITPHFNDSLGATDVDQLCNDLAEGLNTWSDGTQEIKVTGYDAQGSVPVYPQGEAIKNVGVIGTSNYPRELAVCLSFYGDRNIPRHRGRLYVPLVLTGGTASGREVSDATRTKVSDLVGLFTGLGGTNIDWCVYSRIDDQARSVKNWWIDNEWDVIRSRGIKATSRITGTTSE